MKLRTVPMVVVVMSIVGLDLIGVGAHATFTQNTTSAQTITAGTWGVTLSGSSWWLSLIHIFLGPVARAWQRRSTRIVSEAAGW